MKKTHMHKHGGDDALLQGQRFDDALLIAEVGLKADPKNGQVTELD